ncbi:MAG: M14 family zinc carboxypeptidase [Verrucomicrobiales bacterium]|nr:M14 family zinc carboxypeptidase [Verrucomicrobiales bacterium]
MIPSWIAVFSLLLTSVKAGPVHRLTADEYEATLSYWKEKYDPILDIERIGESREGMGIFLLKITDPDSPAGEKQHSLITALHGGPERSGTTATMHVIEWLLSDAEDAKLTRKRQEVWIIPIINPYAYFETDRFGNSLKIDPYTGGGVSNWDLKTMTFKPIDRAPEMAAFLKVVDEFQPEAHLDLHGTGLQEYGDDQLGKRERYQGQIMTEITGSAYSNYVLRPWDWRVTEAMIRAGNEAGFPSDRFEADAQQLLYGPGLEAIVGQHWRGRPQFYSAQYGATKYHTLIAALEVAWEESGLVRTKGWLNIGNAVPAGENVVGYPVDRMKAFVGHFVTTSGTNAAERRKSRVELWQCQSSFSQAFLYPQTDGRSLYAVATNAAAREKLDSSHETFLTNIEGHPSVDASAIREFIESGPEIKIAVEAGKESEVFGTADRNATEHGIGFRLRIPYQNATVERIALNGHPLESAEMNGYRAFQGNGFTQVQVSLDGETAAKSDGLFVITLSYTPPVKRKIGWTPPAAVLEKLKQ